ncbi:sulfate ABC transporter ATP-binding protein [Pseudoroseomonas deserti]|uniref:Sulfate ABC transporter ATP-binding protein n=1 Tax=Teichococcus deserti TaxID=1817963 RepID=A0A1V2H6S6_9PROT|nr:sulfate ABC transporter ATP-binding protein [Pseudoroseomonas deserti]ONG57052.1 sulfate ABC transporter ATP-binding protein [Pseudoroseomonas deserti]
MSLELRGLSRRFDNAQALRDIALQVDGGEFVALLGPSGSGKTTLLRILAGLDFPDQGEVRIDGQDMAQVPARHRRIGFVFQHYALFRHMTVFENVAFGLRVRPRASRPPEAEIAARVRRLLERMQIAELERRLPEQISGGQRQRVALARALAIEPRLLLLDEPFGALDAEVRKGLRHWLRALHVELGLTSLFVTHDQDEAMELADRVAVMQAGRIVQFDTPARILDQPANGFVAGFIGQAQRFAGRLTSQELIFEGLPLAPLPRALLLGEAAAGAGQGPAEAFVRTHEWQATPGPGNAVLRSARAAGGRVQAVFAVGPALIEAEIPPGLLEPGETCQLDPLTARVFLADTPFATG